MVWSTIPTYINTLQPPCYLLLVTGTSELNKIHPFSHPSGPSNVTHGSSVKITIEKSIFMYFMAQFWYFKIFAFVKRGCLGDFFADPISISILHFLSFLMPSIPGFSKIWVLVKSICFSITYFNVCSPWGCKFLKIFPLLWVLNFVIFSIPFYIIQCFLLNSFNIFKVDIPLLNHI